jgi:predicted transcriptional regulator
MSQEPSGSQITRPPTDRLDVPDQLVAADTKLVYLFVTAAGGATVDELTARLAMKKIDLYPVLETLSERGLLVRDDDEYVVTSS